ncbi:hypothetical protein LIER_23858 [Lithospermum erythrorhizon]|uniref:Uncharacterized protein n=1 Tax=Lithospermum erythrorhizon TaxID=34254 RepID=A0AAV3R1A9_LITER
MNYARCLINVDVRKPPVLEFGVKMSGGRRYIQKVSYEHYPDYCCDCKEFGHNVFKCPKKPNVDGAPVNPPKVPRPKANAKAKGVGSSKAPLPKENANAPIGNSPLPGAVGCVAKASVPFPKGKGPVSILKGAGKANAHIAPVSLVSPNSFEALNGAGEISGTKDLVDVKIVMDVGALGSSTCVEGAHGTDKGTWQHVVRKGNSKGRGGAVSTLVSP